MWGLLHDASEAYMADMPRPVKRQLPTYQHLEQKMLEQFAGVYGLCWPIPEEIHHADNVLLATEKRDLMVAQPASWGLEGVEPLEEVIIPLSPEESKKAFLERYEELLRVS
jgi:5'-deoxynucleotidase YfbR-like HD superfamily hydrolase